MSTFDAPKRVLVVDDDEHIRTFLCGCLKEAAYETLTAADGSECLQLIQEKEPDLILLDLDMPRVSGGSVLAMMHHHETMRLIPVIVVTGHDSAENRRLARQFGGYDFILKPFSISDLLERVRNALVSLDMPALERMLIGIPEKDPGLSLLVTEAAGKEFNVHLTKFQGLDVRILVPGDFSRLDPQALSQLAKGDRILVFADLKTRWKKLWPGATPKQEAKPSLLRKTA